MNDSKEQRGCYGLNLCMSSLNSYVKVSPSVMIFGSGALGLWGWNAHELG